jgi:hypothetical protein
MPRPPDHPDLLALLDLVDELDRLLEDATDGVTHERLLRLATTDRVDLRAASHVGHQRARQMWGADTSASLIAQMADLALGAALWQEGVLVGVALERRRQRGRAV